MCCENPIDLGCVNSCENVTTAVALVGTNTYTVKFMFNGVEITRTFTTTGIDGLLEIPVHYFNEGAPVTFALYDSQGTYINCYKFNVSPMVTLTEDVEDVVVLDSAIEYVNETCDGTYSVVTLRMTFSNIVSFTDGAIIYLRMNKSNPSEARYQDVNGSPIEMTGDLLAFTIPDTANITTSNMLFQLLVNNLNCASPQNIEINVLNYAGLIDGVSIGTNEVLSFTTA